MSNHIVQEIGDVLVSNRLAHAILLAVAIAATAAGVFVLSHGVQPKAAAMGDTATVPANPAAIPVLPTVFVEAQAMIPTLPTVIVQADAIPMLPTVVVRANRVEHSDLVAQNAESPALLAAEQDLHRLASGTNAGGGYDMPYYSFGKTLRRLNKE